MFSRKMVSPYVGDINVKNSFEYMVVVVAWIFLVCGCLGLR